MKSKSVLGNDPFKRGAPLRSPPPVPLPTVAQLSEQPSRADEPKKEAIPAALKSVPSRKKRSSSVKARQSVARTTPTEASPTENSPRSAVFSDQARGWDTHTSAVGVRGLMQAFTRAAATAIGARGSAELDAFGRDEALVDNTRPLVDFLYSRYFRVQVDGAEKIPHGPVIFVANHSGAIPLDGLMITEALRKSRPDLGQTRWLSEDQVFYAPLWGLLINRLGAVRASPENADRLLAEKTSVVVFPEGILGIGKPFRERYQLKRFGRGGFVKLALRAKVPLIPVSVVGAEESSPLMARLPIRPLGLPYLPVTPPLPLPVQWKISFGEPIDAGASVSDPSSLEAIAQMTEVVRSAIADRIGTMRDERDPLWKELWKRAHEQMQLRPLFFAS